MQYLTTPAFIWQSSSHADSVAQQSSWHVNAAARVGWLRYSRAKHNTRSAAKRCIILLSMMLFIPALPFFFLPNGFRKIQDGLKASGNYPLIRYVFQIEK